MVTTHMRRVMPNYLITKDLWADIRHFDAEYEGRKLADNLDYGFEMSYGGSAIGTLSPYESKGMSKDSLCKGFWEKQLPHNVEDEVEAIKDHGYRGCSIFIWENTPDAVQAIPLTKRIQTALYGEGNFEEMYIKSVRPPMRVAKSSQKPLLHERRRSDRYV